MPRFCEHDCIIFFPNKTVTQINADKKTFVCGIFCDEDNYCTVMADFLIVFCVSRELFVVMEFDNLFQSEKKAAAGLGLSRTRGSALVALALGLLLMALLPVSCRGDGQPERTGLVIEI
jgi:hypothetical protein